MTDNYPEEGDAVIITDPNRGGEYPATVLVPVSEQCIVAQAAEEKTKLGEPVVWKDIWRESARGAATWRFA